MNNNNTTRELKDVMSYMTEILVNEFPTNTLTQEYLITSILDNKKCHANMLLDNCLMSSNMTDLRNTFVSYLRDHTTPIITKENKINFDANLQNILVSAEKEIDASKNPMIGTEHILLALLNPNNSNTKMQEIFRSMGIDYSFMLTKCNEKAKKLQSQLVAVSKKMIADFKKNNNAQNMMPFAPLKSDINTKTLIPKNSSIQNYTIDISSMANQNKFDDLIGRTKEVEEVIKVLARRKKNNVILVGKAGCGKTSIVHGLAMMIESGNVPDVMKDKKIVQLNIAALVAGTFLRGAFEERVKSLFDEMKNTSNYILFIDDMHNVLRSTSKEKDTDISSMINEILSEGDIRVVGTTSFKDYRNAIESNTMISRRLQKIIINPTTKEETIEILNKNKHYYEDYHNVEYTQEAIEKCVTLSERYITDRSLPDSAIDVLDFSGAHTCLINRKPQYVLDAEKSLNNLQEIKSNMLNNGDFEGADSLLDQENNFKNIIADFDREIKTNKDRYTIKIDVDAICNSISELTSIPVSKLTIDDKKQLAQINNILKEFVVGQDEAIDKICKVIKRNKLGLGNKNRPIGVFLAQGKSGCGKTLIAKKLAEEVFGDENALVRIDMSEYSEKSSVSKLIGASAGYVGYENGGQLTEAVKHKQRCVLLLDEIEKADKEVYNLFLQLFDEGRLTDNSGQIINFKNVIVLMTSNVGTKRASDFANSVGFNDDASSIENRSKELIAKEVKSRFAPEFLNRIDEIIYFNDLTDDNLKEISRLEMNKLVKRINEIGYHVVYGEDVVNLITNECNKNKEFGARPILRFIQDKVEDNITDLLLMNDYPNGYIFTVTANNNEIQVF